MKWKWKRKWEANVLCCAIAVGGKPKGGKLGKTASEREKEGGGASIFAFWRAPVISSLRSFGVWGKMSTDWLTGRKYIQIISNVRIHSSRVICYAPTNKAKWGINIRNYAAVNWLGSAILGSHFRAAFHELTWKQPLAILISALILTYLLLI